MRSLSTRRVVVLGVLVPLLVLSLGAAPAYAAAGGHLVVPDASIIGILTSPIRSVFSAIGGAVLGAFSWTISLASKFILITLGALVKMLIPRSWAKDAVQVFQWIVAIPDYAGTVTSPGGGHVYGFAGVNDLRELFQWLGIGLLPLTLVYATSRAMLGRGDHVAAPVARVVILAGLLVSYPYWWEQGAALTNQLTHVILSPAPVVSGIHQLMAYATEGVALGGWQLVDLALMAALALELLGLIFLKVVIILLGALLFATGPLMIGLVPTESGDVIARGWISAVATILMLPVAWAALFAAGAVLVGDASTAGPLIGGSTQVGSLLGGVIVAVAGAATLWLCLKAAREVGGLLRLQLGGLLVIAGRARSHASSAQAAAAGGTSRAATAASSIRGFQGKVSAAGAAALGAAGPRTAAAASAAGTVGRRGLVMSGVGAAGSAAVAAGRLVGRSGPGSAARPHLAAAAPSSTTAASAAGSRTGRAGAVASRMARAGTAAWQQHDPSSPRTTGRATSAAPGGTGDAREAKQPSRSAAVPGRGVSGTPAGSPAPARSGAAPTRAAASSSARSDPQPARSAASGSGSGEKTRTASRDSREAGAPVRSSPAPAPGVPRSRTKATQGNDARPAAKRTTPPPAPDRAPQTAPPAPEPPRSRSTRSDPPSGRE
jgi:hypothetical protein